MALQFNNFAKVNGILNGILQSFGTTTINVYPSSVTFPTIPLGAAPAGQLIQFTSVALILSGSQIVLNGIPASKSATVTGTANWVHIANGSNYMATTSIGITGASNIITLNTLSLVSGTSYQLTAL